MPIPHTPSATSLDKPSTVKTENEPVDDMELSARRSGEWEEPHPGQRYSYPVKGNACCGVVQHLGNGVQGISMAAKGYSPYPIRGFGMGTGIRRISRPKLRPSLRPHKMSTNVMQDGGKPNMTTHSLQSNASSAKPLIEAAVRQPLPVDLAKSPLSIDPVFEMDSEKELDGLGSDVMDTTPSESSSPRLSMLDFPNQLNVAMEQAKDYDSCNSMCLEPIVYSHDPSVLPSASPEEDRYGWESELGQKYCPSAAYHHYRRAGGAKRSLLHRVLHLSAKQPS